MKKHRLTSAVTLAATAALALPGAASAATTAPGPPPFGTKYGTVSVKAPKCSKGTTAKITITAKPIPSATVVEILLARRSKPTSNSDLLSGWIYGVNAAFKPIFVPGGAKAGESRSVTATVPVGQKVYPFGGMLPAGTTGGRVTQLSPGPATLVAKCPKPHFTG